MPERGAGAFRLVGAAAGAATAATAGAAEADDIALILHTSGTTSRPKIVPLTPAQRLRRPRAISRRALALHGRADRGLNIMPLFHIHGLIAGLLAPLVARRRGVLHAGLQRAEILRLDGGGEADLVHGGADHASGDPDAGRAEQREIDRAPSAALHPLVVVLAAAAGDRRARGDVRRAGDRGLRHDRGRASDGLQPAAAACASRARSASPPGRRSRSWTRPASCWPPGEIGEIVIRGDNVTAGYENNAEGQRRGLHQRLVPHRRPGRDRRRGLSHADRPAEGDHQPRRREDLAARGRRGPDGPSGGAAGRHLRACRTTSSARTSRPRSCCARAPGATEAGAARVPSPSGSPTSRCRAKILFLDEIPKGATGKLQRIGLAQKLGLGISARAILARLLAVARKAASSGCRSHTRDRRWPERRHCRTLIMPEL